MTCYRAGFVLGMCTAVGLLAFLGLVWLQVPRAPAVDGWEALRIEGDEVFLADTLEELRDMSDLVVLATVASVKPGRVVQGGEPEDQVQYLAMNVVVVEHLSQGTTGTRDEETLTVELLWLGDDSPSVSIEQLDGQLRGVDLLLFLHEKQGKGEAGLFRPTTFDGIIASTDRSDVDIVLRPSTQEPAPFAADLARFTTIGAVADHLKGL